MRNWLASFLICALIFPLAAVSLLAAPAPATFIVTVTTTSRQAILVYTAPNLSPCTVEVSEEADYSPVIDDVNATLFPASNSDDRLGSIGVGTTSRSFVVGTIPLPNKTYDNLATDGKFYGRSLVASTTYYYRVTCGSDTGSGSFTTKNIPAGKTYPEHRGVAADGRAPFPTLDSNRSTSRTRTYIDSAVGLKYRQLTAPRDYASDSVLNQAFTSASGTGWTSPSNVLADDAAVAAYSGTTQQWLYVAAPNVNIQTNAIYAIKLLTKGNATGAGDNAVLQICLTRDAVTCLSDVQEMTLSASSNTTVCFPNSNCSDPSTMNTWRNPPIMKEELSAGTLGSSLISGWGVLMRKKGTGAGTVNLQYAQFDWLVDYMPSAYDNGAQWACGPSTIADSAANTGYLCVIKMQGIDSLLYWIPTNTALTSRFLGRMQMVGEATMPNLRISSSTATWSDTDPRKYYFTAVDNSANSVLVVATLPASGNTYYDADSASSALWTPTYTNLTVAPNHLTSLIDDVDATFTSSFGCSESTVQRGRVFVKCRRGQQDSYGYIASYNLSTGLIERVLRTWDRPNHRWCGYHTEEPADKNSQQYMWTTSELNKGGVASGPFTFTLDGGINDSQTSLLVTSTHSTPGEPVETNAPTELMAKAVNDLFQIDNETFRITAITSPTQITVERGYGPSNPAAHSNGAAGMMLCTGVNWAVDSSQGPSLFWNVEDGTEIIDNGTLAGSHGAYVSGSPGYRIAANGGAMTITDDTDPIETVYSVLYSPCFAGICPDINGNDHQKHPSSAQQVDAASGQKNWGSDVLAQISHAGFNLNSPVHVTGSLWKFTKSGADYNPKILPTHASVGVKLLTNISSTSTGNVIQGNSYYTFCVARAVNECRTGSTVGDIYAAAPAFGEFTVTNATNTTPIVVTTSAPHGWFQRGTVTIAGVGGNTATNGTRTVTPLTPTTFSVQDINSVDVAGNGTYTSGGTAIRTPACFSGGESITLGYGHQEDEMCFGDTPPYSQQVIQLRLDRVDTTGRNGRQLGHMFSPPHRLAATASTKVTPDGKWMILASNPSFNFSRSTENMLLQLTDFPADDLIDRTTFVVRNVALVGPLGAATAVIDYGYTSDFYATSRDELTLSATGNSESNPFFFESESYTRVTCPAGLCTIGVRMIPDRVAYCRARYFDSGGSLIETGATFLLTDASAAQGSAAKGSITGKATLSGKAVGP